MSIGLKCINCIHCKEIVKHPWNDGDSKGMTTDFYGIGCLHPYHEGRIVFFDDGDLSSCEMYEDAEGAEDAVHEYEYRISAGIFPFNSKSALIAAFPQGEKYYSIDPIFTAIVESVWAARSFDLRSNLMLLVKLVNDQQKRLDWLEKNRTIASEVVPNPKLKE